MMKKTLILWVLLVVVIISSVFGYLFFQQKNAQKEAMLQKEQNEKALIDQLVNYETLPNEKSDSELVSDLENNVSPGVAESVDPINQLEDFNFYK
jgi:regulatory protein YycI of two-component signal transduction system YycFG